MGDGRADVGLRTPRVGPRQVACTAPSRRAAWSVLAPLLVLVPELANAENRFVVPGPSVVCSGCRPAPWRRSSRGRSADPRSRASCSQRRLAATLATSPPRRRAGSGRAVLGMRGRLPQPVRCARHQAARRPRRASRSSRESRRRRSRSGDRPAERNVAGPGLTGDVGRAGSPCAPARPGRRRAGATAPRGRATGLPRSSARGRRGGRGGRRPGHRGRRGRCVRDRG